MQQLQFLNNNSIFEVDTLVYDSHATHDIIQTFEKNIPPDLELS